MEITVRLFVLCCLLFWATPASAGEVTIQPLVETEQSFDEWINQDFKPVDPMTSYHAKDRTTWTGWNKFWFASAVGGQAADIISTKRGLDRGCSEGNPIYGDNPSTGALILAKAGMLGAGWLVTEWWLDRHPYQQSSRNWLYGAMTVAGLGAATWNESIDCR